MRGKILTIRIGGDMDADDRKLFASSAFAKKEVRNVLYLDSVEELRQLLSPEKMRLLSFLINGPEPETVSGLAAKTKRKQTAVSRDLASLQCAGMVELQKNKHFVHPKTALPKNRFGIPKTLKLFFHWRPFRNRRKFFGLLYSETPNFWMGQFEILETEPFSELFQKLEKREHEWVFKMKLQLQTNPFAGKPLRFEWFREKKFEGKRLYFLVHGQKKRIMLVAFGTKKDQQKTIDYILAHRTEFWEELDKV